MNQNLLVTKNWKIRKYYVKKNNYYVFNMLAIRDQLRQFKILENIVNNKLIQIKFKYQQQANSKNIV